MKNNNCNLELRLFPFSDSDDNHHRRSFVEDLNESPKPEEGQEQEQKQTITIFYNGSICVCDVTEFQARNILMLASSEMEDKSTSSSPEPPSPTVVSPVSSPGTGLSMKRSLQRFLQKRNHRIQATCPYNINRRRIVG